LSFEHSDIEVIVNQIRHDHTESFLSPTSRLSYNATLRRVRLVCSHGREADVAEVRERKTRTQRADDGSDGCPACLNIFWSQVRPTVFAWRVGKIVTGHKDHIARVHREVKLTQEQRQTFGAEMVDAQLTAAQLRPKRARDTSDEKGGASGCF